MLGSPTDGPRLTFHSPCGCSEPASLETGNSGEKERINNMILPLKHLISPLLLDIIFLKSERIEKYIISKTHFSSMKNFRRLYSLFTQFKSASEHSAWSEGGRLRSDEAPPNCRILWYKQYFSLNMKINRRPYYVGSHGPSCAGLSSREELFGTNHR